MSFSYRLVRTSLHAQLSGKRAGQRHILVPRVSTDVSAGPCRLCLQLAHKTILGVSGDGVDHGTHPELAAPPSWVSTVTPTATSARPGPSPPVAKPNVPPTAKSTRQHRHQAGEVTTVSTGTKVLRPFRRAQSACDDIECRGRRPLSLVRRAVTDSPMTVEGCTVVNGAP